MFSLTSSFCYYLYRNPTDMRLGMDGLCGLVRGQLRRSPGSGEVFLFINKPRNKVKLLRWEEGGFILYYKRLEQGTFELPTFSNTATSCVLGWAELVMIIEGISIQKIKHRKRFSKFSGYQQNGV